MIDQLQILHKRQIYIHSLSHLMGFHVCTSTTYSQWVYYDVLMLNTVGLLLQCHWKNF